MIVTIYDDNTLVNTLQLSIKSVIVMFTCDIYFYLEHHYLL